VPDKTIYGNMDDVYLFCQVVDKGSLQAAATSLNVPISTMSRRISALESRLNTRLLEKQGRELNPTESGRQVYQALKADFAHLETAFTQVLAEQQQEVSGSLRLAFPHQFYNLFIGKILNQYTMRYPKVKIDVMLNHRLTVPETNRDLVIRFDLDNLEGMVARELFSSSLGIYVGSQIHANLPPEMKLEQLADLEWVGLEHWNEINVFRGAERIAGLQVQPKLIVNDVHAIIDFVQTGVGVAILPSRLITPEMELIRLFPDYHLGHGSVYLVYRDRKYQPNALKILIEMLVKGANEQDQADTLATSFARLASEPH